MVDTHTHLNFQAFDQDWQQVVEKSLQSGVTRMIIVGTDIDSSQKAIKMASTHPALFASVGIHPHHSRQWAGMANDPASPARLASKRAGGQLTITNAIKELRKLAKNKKVVAIGEVGLDYHHYQKSKHEDKEVSPQLINLQKELLLAQIKLAAKLDKPLILHSREAKTDVLDLIENWKLEIGNSITGVFHCFDGSKKYAQKIIDAGFYISFTGNITYNDNRANIAKSIPLDRLLLETDCPFMKPRPNTGDELRALPSDVKITGQLHAKTRGLTELEVFDTTTKNANLLFKLASELD